VAEAKPVFTRLFKEYGLPKRIRTDNGVPFATNTLARLPTLSAWWIRLGILPELIEPGKPQQNGRHERMHRTLKAETTRPPANTCRGQQRKFDRFRKEFNSERPHEALDMQTPGSLYQSSPREIVQRLDQRIHDPECARETRLAYRNSQCPSLRRRLVAKVPPMLRLPESSFGSGNQRMRHVERLGNHNPILGPGFELPSGDEMLRIRLNGFIADVALSDDLCRAEIFGKWRTRGLPSCSDPGPVAQRWQRHCEFLADFSKGNVRYAVAFRHGSDGFCPDFLVELGPLIAKSYVRHGLPRRSIGKGETTSPNLPNLVGVIRINA
jgi:hypothetical protein